MILLFKSEHIVMSEEQLIKKAVQVLMREFGPVEASRFYPYHIVNAKIH